MSAQKFVMPEVEKGEPVIWVPFRGASKDEECAAMVTEVGYNAVSLSLLPPNNRGCIPKGGVRHIDDPDVRAQDQREPNGFWKRTNLMQSLRNLSCQFE